MTYRASLLGLQAMGESFDTEDCCDFVYEGFGVAGVGRGRAELGELGADAGVRGDVDVGHGGCCCERM